MDTVFSKFKLKTNTNFTKYQKNVLKNSEKDSVEYEKFLEKKTNLKRQLSNLTLQKRQQQFAEIGWTPEYNNFTN